MSHAFLRNIIAAHLPPQAATAKTPRETAAATTEHTKNARKTPKHLAVSKKLPTFALAFGKMTKT